MAEILPRLLEALRKQLPEAVELRYRLHAHPELGNQERRTREDHDRLTPISRRGLRLTQRSGSPAGTP